MCYSFFKAWALPRPQRATPRHRREDAVTEAATIAEGRYLADRAANLLRAAAEANTDETNDRTRAQYVALAERLEEYANRI